MSLEYYQLDDTVYFAFAGNDTSGSGGDGASPLFDVRLCGTAADAAPVYSGSATLLTHANYPAGAHEVAIVASAANGFAAGNTYTVYCTLLVDSQNPTGFVGKFKLDVPAANLTEIGGVAQSATDLKDLADTGYNPATHKLAGVVLADTCTTNTDMRGTDGANTVVPATKAEMDTAHALLATVAKQDVIYGIVDAILEDVTGINGAAMRGTDSAATAVNLAIIAGYLDEEIAAILAAVDTEVAAIKAVTDALPDAGALSSLAQAAALVTVDTVVDAALAILKADKVIDTSQTPWELVLYTQGAAQEAGNEIFRKALSQPDGTAVSSSDHIVGQEEHTT